MPLIADAELQQISLARFEFYSFHTHITTFDLCLVDFNEFRCALHNF